VAELERLIGARDYREFIQPRKLKDVPANKAEALKAIAADPNLLRRPIVVDGNKVYFGFKEAEWNALKR